MVEIRNTANVSIIRHSNGGFLITANLTTSNYGGSTMSDISSFSDAKEVGMYFEELCNNLDIPEKTIVAKKESD